MKKLDKIVKELEDAYQEYYSLFGYTEITKDYFMFFGNDHDSGDNNADNSGGSSGNSSSWD